MNNGLHLNAKGAAMQDQNSLRPDPTVGQVCTLLNTTPPTVYKLIHTGKLDSYTIGRGRRITIESLERLRQQRAA